MKMSTSNILYIANIITAANVALGINWKVDVNRPHAKSTKEPVIKPPIGVLTPEALLMAVRVKLPVTGIDLTKLPKILEKPSANISWLASNVLPFAANFLIKLSKIPRNRIMFYLQE